MTSKAETVYSALLTKLQSVAGLGTLSGSPNVSRNLKDPSQVANDTLPALFICQTGEEISATKGFEGFNAKQQLSCDLVLYVRQVKESDIPSTQINEMLQNIRTALYPTAPDNSQTLNGTVSHCWISGKIEIIEGVLNGQGIAIIPVSILTNT